MYDDDDEEEECFSTMYLLLLLLLFRRLEKNARTSILMNYRNGTPLRVSILARCTVWGGISSRWGLVGCWFVVGWFVVGLVGCRS
jgi:hypothetical protein